MNKRLLSLIMAVLMCVTLFGCGGTDQTSQSTADGTVSAPVSDASSDDGQKEQGDGSSITPLLYKVTDKNGNTAWLFGSIHVGREDYYPLPDYVMDAYRASDALAVEFDVIAFETDLAAQMNMLSTMMCPKGTTIKNYVSESTYKRAAAILEENGQYSPVLDYYIPSLWSSFVDQCIYTKIGLDMDSGIDKHLLKDAKESGKTIIDVESAQEQYGMMRDFSLELQLYLLESSIESYGQLEEYKQEVDTMLSIWAEGNEEKFSEYLGSSSDIDAEEDPDAVALYEEYYKAMNTDRDKGMTEYAVEALGSGKVVFICVGAAHVVGEGAMVDQLRALGYTVESVRG